ncbi:FlxA-like family protein [Marinomonas sp. TI.3.20]|uniref:FlxA-like family protein n=1 Tax=Marinomonas sp. TI.3.20 TaxID=3121296 RepID=UPI00311F7AC6
MNIFTKSALILLAASSMATTAFAAQGDGTYGSISRSESQINTLTSQIEHLGQSVDTSADVNAALSLTAKAAVLNAKVSDLRLQLSALQAQRSE